jgi:hypothetical protein
MKLFYSFVLIVVVISGICSCSPPKSIINSGKVATKNQVRFGYNNSVNISTSPISESVKGIQEFSAIGQDSFQFTKGLEHLNTVAIAYALDPIGYKTDYYLRYGLGHNLDLGYRHSGKSHTFDMRYQFLGSNSTWQYSDYKGMYGSVGLQFGWHNYGFTDKKFEELKKIFDLRMTRKDVSVPLIFSKAFGPEEKYGALSFGLVYTHCFIRYNVNPRNVYVSNSEGVQQFFEPLNAKMNYSSYGTFVNVKAGWKFIYFVGGISCYYQKYGTYPLLGGNQVKLKGFTFVPNYGFQFNILPRKKKTELRNM